MLCQFEYSVLVLSNSNHGAYMADYKELLAHNNGEEFVGKETRKRIGVKIWFSGNVTREFDEFVKSVANGVSGINSVRVGSASNGANYVLIFAKSVKKSAHHAIAEEFIERFNHLIYMKARTPSALEKYIAKSNVEPIRTPGAQGSVPAIPRGTKS